MEAKLIERLKRFPPSRVAEVMDVVEFLASREERAVAAQRLTESLARPDALNLPPVSEDEIEAEVQAARRARRAPTAISGVQDQALADLWNNPVDAAYGNL